MIPLTTRHLLASLLDRLGRPAGLAALAGLYLVGSLAVTGWQRPWSRLTESTWPCGFEAGRIARNICQGDGYASPFWQAVGDDPTQPADPGPPPPTAWTPPPIVLIWTALFRLFGVYSPAAWQAFTVLQALWGVGALALLHRALARAAGPPAAALGALWFVGWPVTWHQVVHDTHTGAFFLLCACLALYALTRLPDGGRWAAVFSAAIGLGVMALPSALPALAGWAAWAWWRQDRAGRGRARLTWALAVALPLLWGPWLVRNLTVFDTLVPFGTNLPMEMYFGNNVDSPADPIQAHLERFPPNNDRLRTRLLAEGEVAFGRWCWHQFDAFVRAQPVAAAALMRDRVVWYWTWHPYKANPFRPILGGILLAALAVCIGLTVRRRHPLTTWEGALWLALALLPLIYYLTHFAEYRYRYPIEILTGILMATLAGGRAARFLAAPSSPPV